MDRDQIQYGKGIRAILAEATRQPALCVCPQRQYHRGSNSPHRIDLVHQKLFTVLGAANRFSAGEPAVV